MKNFDVVIIGAGLAGLECGKRLAQNNVKVLLVDRKKDLTKGIHTTGIFVRKTFEDFDFPSETLGKPISDVTLYSPKLRTLTLKSEKEEFRVGNMGVLYEKLLQDCLKEGVEFLSDTSYISVASEPAKTGTIVNLKKHGKLFQIKTKVLVGADGAKSRVAKDLGLDENREWIVGYEEVFQGVPLKNEPRLHCFLDAKLAPGYLAWITNDGEDCHIGVGGYPTRFDPRKALERFKKEIACKYVDLKDAEKVESRGGRIPVGGVLKKIASENGLLIGDAAGAVSPLTAGGLDPCMRLSKFASEVILERLKANNPQILNSYSGKMFRAKFTTRLWMRYLLKSITNQTFLEFAFKFLHSGFGRKIAEKIFFRRSSFPDVDIIENADIRPIKDVLTL